MRYLGLDIGTTTVSAAVIDTTAAQVLTTQNLPHHADLASPLQGAHSQDADQLVDRALTLLEGYASTYGPFEGIGVTGQMHGVVYVGRDGRAVSPLYTWLDKQAEAEVELGSSYQKLFEDTAGLALPLGYGALTHFTQAASGRLPPDAASLCTVADYLVMRLCDLTQPVTDATLAHSIGLFDMAKQAFDLKLWQRLGGADVGLPSVNAPQVVGYHRTLQQSVPVVTALGDNQASFLGSVKSHHDSVLITLGTSGQLSAVSRPMADVTLTGAEQRPFWGDDFLVVGASLTGGKAFALLASFVDSVALKVTGRRLPNPYALLEVDAEALSPPYVRVDTRFSGSRGDAAVTGAITHIGLDNFNLEQLAHGFAQGIVDELFAFWDDFVQAEVAANVKRVVGSGNLLRSSRLVRQVLQKTFELPLVVPSHLEEAAVGAAIHAAAVVTEKKPERVANPLIREVAADL